MANKEVISKISEENFFKSFHRYFLITHILSSNSWEELKKELNLYEGKEAEKYFDILYKEFQFYNLIKEVEYDISDTLFSAMVEKRKIKSWKGIKSMFISKIKKYKHIKNDRDVKRLIKKETDGKDSYMLTPHFLYFVSGCGIGELISIIKDNIKDFDKKSYLLSELMVFNNSRTKIIHNLLSSRIDYEKEIIKGLESGKKIGKIIEECQEIKDYFKKRINSTEKLDTCSSK